MEVWREQRKREGRERESVSVCVISKVHRIFLASRLIVLFPLFSTATDLRRYCVWMIGEWWHKRGCPVDDQVVRSIYIGSYWWQDVFRAPLVARL